MNLFEISQEIMTCVNEDGEIIDDEKLEALTMERNSKIENISLWVKNLRAEAEALKAEEKAFAERRKAAENKANSLTDYLTRYLDGQKFETAKVKLSFRKSEFLDIAEGAVIPEEYLKYKEPEVDKTLLKKCIKVGLEIPGVTLCERQNLQIK